MRAVLASFVIALGVWVPRAAQACAVCTSGRDDETRLAFLLTTLFLSVLPLAMVGAGVWWLVRRARALERARIERETGIASPAVSRSSSSP